MIVELSEYFTKDRYFSESAIQNIIDLINKSQLDDNQLKQIIETCNSKMKNSSNSINNSTTSTNNSLPTWEEAKQILSTTEDPKIRLKNFYERCYNENCKKYDEIVKQIESIISSNLNNTYALSNIDSNANNAIHLNNIKTQEKSFKQYKNLIRINQIRSLCQLCQDSIDKNQINYSTNKYNHSTLDEIKKLFKEAFKYYLLNGGDNNNELFDIEINSDFDPQTMRKVTKSIQNAPVKECLMSGIRYKIGNRIIVQALVILG